MIKLEDIWAIYFIRSQKVTAAWAGLKIKN
jgi:hypothetical protein